MALFGPDFLPTGLMRLIRKVSSFQIKAVLKLFQYVFNVLLYPFYYDDMIKVE